MKTESYRKRYIYYSTLMYFLNMYENNKKSIFVEQREYVMNLLFPKFYTNYVENCAILLTHSLFFFF